MLGIVTTAPPAQTHGRLRQGRWSPVSLRRGSRPSRGSAALALSTRGFPAGTVGETARLVADACAAGVAVVKKIALPSGGANAHDVFAAGGSSIGGARRGSSARVASCLPCSMATLRTAAGFMERCAARGAARGAGRAASADRYANACYRVARRETGHAGRSGAWGASRRDVRTRARGAGGVTCDTGVSSLAATTLRRFAHLWLRMRGCGKVSNAAETQPHATETHDGDTGQLPSRCVMAHTAHACWLSRAPAGLLGPGGACRSEPIQGRQPVPLDSVALLLRRARLDDAVGRLGLLRIGPRLAARPSSSEAKK